MDWRTLIDMLILIFLLLSLIALMITARIMKELEDDIELIEEDHNQFNETEDQRKVGGYGEW